MPEIQKDYDSSDESLEEISDDISDYESDACLTPIKSNKSNSKQQSNSLRKYNLRKSTLNNLRVPPIKLTLNKDFSRKNSPHKKLLCKKSPSKKSLNKKQVARSSKKQNKNDSDSSDIDLDDCTSADDDTYYDYVDDEDYDPEECEEAPTLKRSRSHRLNGGNYNNLVTGVVDFMLGDVNDSAQEKKKRQRRESWQKDMSIRDVKKYEKEYDAICETISILPTIQELLQINIPFKTKCDLMEKIIILENIENDTFEHLSLKKTILGELDKYKRYNLMNTIYSKYSELEKKLESSNSLELPVKYRILSSDMEFKNKIVVYQKYKYLNSINEQSSDHPKLMNWINTALKLPTKIDKIPVSIKDSKSKISKFLSDVRYTLDKEIYGMRKAKEQILCILNNKITNPKLIGSAMALHGVQGIGKTKLIQSLAKAIKLPFTSISMGGASDGSFLNGHNYTYEGSRPGCIVDSLTIMGSLGGILFFDEVDKISKTRSGDEISKSLLHVTDFTQNHKFTDKYLGNSFEINLSRMWFFYSLNYVELIDKTLADRIPIINMEGYDNKQKKDMAFKYLIPDALKNINISSKDIIFSPEAIEYMIQQTNKMYTRETQDKKGNSGVRKLKEAINAIIMKVNLLRNTIKKNGEYNIETSFNIDNFKIPFTVGKDHVDKLDVLNKEDNSCPIPGMYI